MQRLLAWYFIDHSADSSHALRILKKEKKKHIQNLHTLELCGTIININKASNASWASWLFNE
jgi:hypothetical protein